MSRRFRAWMPMVGAAWLAVLEQACTSSPPSASRAVQDPLFGEARVDLAASRPRSATEKFLELLATYGDDFEILKWLGRSQILAGESAAGRSSLHRALERRPDDLQSLSWLADSAYQDGLDQDALDAYRKVIEIQPDHEIALERLAELHLRLGHENRALELLNRLLVRHPRRVDLRLQAIQASLRIEQYEATEEHARAYLEIERNPHVLASLAVAITRGNPRSVADDPEDLAAAIACLEEATALDPNDERLQHNLAWVLEARGEHARSEACYRRALEINPEHLSSLEHLANMYLGQEDFERARPLLERALELEVQRSRELSNREGVDPQGDSRINALRDELKRIAGSRESADG